MKSREKSVFIALQWKNNLFLNFNLFTKPKSIACSLECFVVAILRFCCIVCQHLLLLFLKKIYFFSIDSFFLYSVFKVQHWRFDPSKPNSSIHYNQYSIERRWSSRTFRYGYLVTTSPQSLASPSAAPSLRSGHRLRVLPTPMVWRAVCTRPGNVFTATFWFAITSDSSFM